MELYVDKELINIYTQKQRYISIRNILSFLEDNNRIIYKIEIDGNIYKFPNAISDNVYNDFVKEIRFTTLNISAYLDILIKKCVVKLEDFYKELDDILKKPRSEEENYLFEFTNSFILFTKDLMGICDDIYKNLGIKSFFVGQKFNILLENLKIKYSSEVSSKLYEFLFFEIDPLFNSWIEECKRLYNLNQDVLLNNDENMFLSSLYTFINDLNTENHDEYEEEIYYNTTVHQKNIKPENLPEDEFEEPESEDLPAEDKVEEPESEDLPAEDKVEEPESEDLPEEDKVEEPESEEEANFKQDTWRHSTLTIFDKLYSIYENKK